MKNKLSIKLFKGTREIYAINKHLTQDATAYPEDREVGLTVMNRCTRAINYLAHRTIREKFNVTTK